MVDFMTRTPAIFELELDDEQPIIQMKIVDEVDPLDIHFGTLPANVGNRTRMPLSQTRSTSEMRVPSVLEQKPEKMYLKKSGRSISETDLARHLETKYKVLGPNNITVKDIKDHLGLEKIVDLFPEDENKADALDKFKQAQETVSNIPNVELDNPDIPINTMSMRGLAKVKAEKKQCFTNDFFENVNLTVRSHPSAVVVPETLEELQEIVRSASKYSQKIRVVGAGHSWTPVFPEDGAILVSLHQFKNGYSSNLEGPEEDWTITFQAGERIKDVEIYCQINNVCIPTNVVMDHVGFGGLITMGCHGTGYNLKTISDLCVALKLVDAHGEVREFSRKKDGERIWSAMITNLGLFGIVFEYTIRVYKDFNVEVYDYKVPSSHLFGEAGSHKTLKDLVVNQHSSQFFWLPFNEQVWCKVFKVTEREVTVEPVKYVLDSFTNWISMNFGVPLVNLTTKATELTPLFLKAGFATFEDNRYDPRVETIYNAIHWEQALDSLQIMCMEFALPIRENEEEDWKKLGECVRFVQKRVEELATESIFPLNLALEMRFVSNSDGLLNIAYGNEHTCFIEIVSSIDAPIWNEFSTEVATEWRRIFPGARPHWAKMCQQIPGIEQIIRDAYGDNIKEFLSIREELKVDPNDMFYTQWLGNILEPTRYTPYIGSPSLRTGRFNKLRQNLSNEIRSRRNSFTKSLSDELTTRKNSFNKSLSEVSEEISTRRNSLSKNFSEVSEGIRVRSNSITKAFSEEFGKKGSAFKKRMSDEVLTKSSTTTYYKHSSEGDLRHTSEGDFIKMATDRGIAHTLSEGDIPKRKDEEKCVVS